MKSTATFCTAALLVLLTATPGRAGVGDTGEQVYAVQNRLFDRDHELALSAGYVPDDDFHQTYPLGLSYTFHFSPTLAWEVVRGYWVLNREKELKEDLEQEFGATPKDFDQIQYGFHTSLVFKPTYGKDSLWNQQIINHETFLLAGLGMNSYERTSSRGRTSYESAISLGLGIGRKYFLSRSLSVNFELRDTINFKDEGLTNNVYFGLALAYRFDLAPRVTPEDAAVRQFQGYLREDGGDD